MSLSLIKDMFPYCGILNFFLNFILFLYIRSVVVILAHTPVSTPGYATPLHLWKSRTGSDWIWPYWLFVSRDLSSNIYSNPAPSPTWYSIFLVHFISVIDIPYFNTKTAVSFLAVKYIVLSELWRILSQLSLPTLTCRPCSVMTRIMISIEVHHFLRV
jgi:hypothetical protein